MSAPAVNGIETGGVNDHSPVVPEEGKANKKGPVEDMISKRLRLLGKKIVSPFLSRRLLHEHVNPEYWFG